MSSIAIASALALNNQEKLIQLLRMVLEEQNRKILIGKSMVDRVQSLKNIDDILSDIEKEANNGR